MDDTQLHMRRSRVLERLRAGQLASCFKVNIADARAVEIAALWGFDCIWTDMEHVGNDWSVIEQQVWAAKSRDVDIMVRTMRGSYSDHVKPLELDAAGIMVPHIMGLDDAQRVVNMTRFHPVGRRPMDGGNADGAYCNIDLLSYIHTANRQRFVCIQIEDPEPLDDLEAIAALDGIDIVFFGPGDFSQGIGAPGVWHDPRIDDTRRRVADICLAKGKFAGTVGSPDTIDDLMAMGFRFISMGADVAGLSQYCRDLAMEFRKRQR